MNVIRLFCKRASQMIGVSRICISFVAIMFVGCEANSLSTYEAFPASRDLAVFRSLQDDELFLLCLTCPPPPPVVDGSASDASTQAAYSPSADAAADLRQVKQTIATRPGSPTFRSLCALINRYWGNWDRLVIIERWSFEPEEYDFVVAGFTKDGIRIVTSLGTDDSDVRVSGGSLRAVKTDAAKVHNALGELEKAAPILPEILLVYPNVEWPIYIVHDIRRDGRSFSFGLFGSPDWLDEDSHPLRRLTYGQAAELVPKSLSLFDPPGVDMKSPQARDVREAGMVYAKLLAKVWDSLLPQRDREFLGRFSAK